VAARDGTVVSAGHGTAVVLLTPEHPHRKEQVMSTIITHLGSRLFWDKKLRIALLTIATFAALC
jgi:hypothetical protein